MEFLISFSQTLEYLGKDSNRRKYWFIVRRSYGLLVGYCEETGILEEIDGDGWCEETIAVEYRIR